MRTNFIILIFFCVKAFASSFDPSIQGVSFFAYQLQNLEMSEAIEMLANSHYDLLVIDDVRSIKGMEDYNSRLDVKKLHSTYGSSVNPKKVFCYLNIGEAEDYRYYYNEEWEVGNPEWIISNDPDGWDGNYPVKFWDNQWKSIIKDYLKKIIEDGFDGAYLDWIEIYSFEPIVQLAEEEGRDPVQEIISFVREIKEYSKSLNPKFSFIAQNASELGVYKDWLDLFSGIGQESIWFTWGGDPDEGEMQGDVPVEEELTEEILSNLKKWIEGGKIVLDIEYAQEEKNVKLAYKNGKENGFITYVTLSELEKLSENPPLDYGIFNLTKNIEGEAANPSFSPDIKNILFSHSYGSGQNLWLLNLITKQAEPLIDDLQHDYVNMPGSSWNKFRDEIVFSSDLSGSDEIWLVHPDGSNLKQITYDNKKNFEPTFSPSGEWIVFQSLVDGNWEIKKKNLNTAETVQLTKNSTDDWEPNWSPKSDLIVYQSNAAGNWDILIMRADGSEIKNITNSPSKDKDPSFSPDGKWIIYSTDRDGGDEPELHLISVENSDLDFRLTFNNSYEGAPSFSPDGKTIAFESDFSGRLDIWTMPIIIPPSKKHPRPF